MKLDALAPPSAMLLTVIGPVPVLYNFTDCAALVVPIAWLANVTLVTDSVAAGVLVLVPVGDLSSNELVVWQALQSYPAVTFGWSLGLVSILTPYQLIPVLWQLAQAFPETAVWFIAVPEKLVKFAGEWQLSHAIEPVGMCVGGGSLGTMLAKLRPTP